MVLIVVGLRPPALLSFRIFFFYLEEKVIEIFFSQGVLFPGGFFFLVCVHHRFLQSKNCETPIRVSELHYKSCPLFLKE